MVLYSLPRNEDIPRTFHNVCPSGTIDLAGNDVFEKLSSAEKASMVVGAFMQDLDKIATVHAPLAPLSPPDTEFTGEYKTKKICKWSTADLQEWLFVLGVKEFYRQSFAENMIDGFLLMSMTNRDLTEHVGIDSKVVRKKIMQQILQTLDKEHKMASNWHLQARHEKPRPACVYIVYDPNDVRMAQTIKQDLLKKGLMVLLL